MNLVDRLLAHPPHRLALSCGPRSTTYGQLAEQSTWWRGGLVAAGIGPGDRVAVLAGNDETVVVAELALLGLGAVIVPLNPQSPPAELVRELAAVEVSAALVTPADEALWEAVARAQDGTGGGRLRRLEPAAWSGADALPAQPVPADSPAALLFTSGTAGMPKPAILTHGNLDASLRAMLALPVELLGVAHVSLAVIPLFHVFGLNAVVNLGLTIGATLVLDDFRDPAAVAALVEQHQVSILSGPPTLWQALAGADNGHSAADRGPGQFASVRLALSGAAKLAPEVHQAVQARLGLRLDEGYGLTETCAVVATGVGRSAPVGSVGRLVAGVEARLVDAEGHDVLVGDPGELWVRGPMVSPGYHRPGVGAEPERRLDGEGWLHTGDVGIVDDDGNLAIVDRLKDLVIVSGFNVYPGEVEMVLTEHPDVAAAAVVGEPDAATGEAVVAHVVAAPGRRPDPAQLAEHCRRHLARYKVPRRIELRDELPRGPGGKLRRQDLR